MSVRNLDAMFKPKSIALIGASKRPDSVGGVLARNLLNSGFDGPVMPVNPHHQAIEGVLTYPDIASLPLTPDLAIISTPPAAIPQIIGELGARGSKAAVVITAGFGEGGSESGHSLRQAMLDAARPHLLRIVGPNCLGILVPEIGLNASFVHITPEPGRLAFVTQSGAVVTSVVDWAAPRGIGFSYLVSLGDMADVDFGDMLDYLAQDAETKAILLYVEAVTHTRKFMSAARAAARMKPVIVVKAGRFAEGARAAASHTGALAGVDAVYDAAFRRAGMLRVDSLEELFDAAETLAMIAPPKGDRLAIVTNGGGAGVLATDSLIGQGGHLAELSQETIAALDKVLPKTWSRANPVDVIGDAPPKRYQDAMEIVLADRSADAVLALFCPTAMASPTAVAEATIAASEGGAERPVLTSWLGDASVGEARHLFEQHGIPSFTTPSHATRAFMHLVDYRRNQEMLTETPPSIPEEFSPDIAAARAIIDKALGEGREWLSEWEAKAVFAAYAIPVVRTTVAATPEEAEAQALEIGGETVLKILSPDILHKSDAGGVVVGLRDAAAVRQAAEKMLERLSRSHPDAHIEGFTVQEMIRRPGAHELIIGAIMDQQFGATLLFGQGGTAVEVVNDKVLTLPPLNMHLAREAMSRTRVHKLLKGYRDRPSADLEAIALTLVKVSQLVIDIPEIEEIDINPLLADENGVIALDARIRASADNPLGSDRLAIRPYPKELEEDVELGDGRTLLLRPIVPEDEPSLQAAFSKLTEEEIRFRFFVPLKALEHARAARFTQIDYDREMALILTDPGIPGRTEIYAVVRLIADPDNEKGEFAIILRGEMTGLGLGQLLLRRIVDYARQRGITEVFGHVMRENTNMLRLSERLGFKPSTMADEPGVVKVTLAL